MVSGRQDGRWMGDEEGMACSECLVHLRPFLESFDYSL